MESRPIESRPMELRPTKSPRYLDLSRHTESSRHSEVLRPIRSPRYPEHSLHTELVQITKDNNFILQAFLFSLSRNPSPYFRYYNTRSQDEYHKHIYTTVIVDNMLPVAYGHIELEDKYWLALCVLEEHRGQGYGRMLLEKLIEVARSKRIPRLCLSVDKDNITAISLYRKYSFSLLYEHDKYYVMTLNLLPSAEVVMLPVSHGDAFDKLAILEIKMTKVNDVKRVDVRKEYDAVLTSISHLFNETVKFYYKHLIDCSIIIWDKQVKFRSLTVSNNSSKQEKTELCEEIIFENDRRGKLKNKVNKVLSSYLVEQKDGYILKKAFISIGLELKRIIWSVGMIRYLATIYDEVLVYTVRTDQFALVYLDDDTIRCTTKDECPEGYTSIVLEDNIMDYNKIGLNREYFFTYFYVPTTNKSIEMYERLAGKEYIVVDITDMTYVKEEMGNKLIVNINKTDTDYGDYFMSKNITDYKHLLINASALYLSDNALFHLAINLELKSDSCYYFSEHNYDYIYNYLPENINRRRFRRLNA